MWWASWASPARRACSGWIVGKPDAPASLRRAAEAACQGKWWTPEGLETAEPLFDSDDVAYIVAADPRVVLDLLDTIDRIIEHPIDESKSAGWHFAEVRRIAREALDA